MSEAAHILPVWMRFDEALEYSRLSRERLRGLLRDGVVVGRKDGKLWIVSRESIDEYLRGPYEAIRLQARAILAR